MNDRFKFRVWKGQENRMVYDVTYLNPLILDPTIKEENKHNILMQCTGLHDKNGKLIYEADLLKPLGEDDERVEIVWNEEKARFGLMIQWTDSCYWNGLYDETKTSRDYYEFDDYYIENFEVIGNIYENKELLDE
jgi:uncharacterized phage protein (TIGR01671 family)